MLEFKVKVSDKSNTQKTKEELNKIQNQYAQEVNLLIQNMRCKIHQEPPQCVIINSKPNLRCCCDEFADIVTQKIETES